MDQSSAGCIYRNQWKLIGAGGPPKGSTKSTTGQRDFAKLPKRISKSTRGNGAGAGEWGGGEYFTRPK